MISQERYKDINARIIQYICTQIQNENLEPLEACELAYCIVTDIRDGYITSLESRGIVFIDERPEIGGEEK